MYPGASAEVLESTVAQPLEAQIVGVDKMLYMKSTSGNDGSYTLDVSFELGSDPDIDTVNVNNRVQTALAQLPQEVQLQGLKVQKKSSSILQFVVMSSENGQYDPLFITNYAKINVLDELARVPGVGEAKLLGLDELLDEDLVRHAAFDQPRPFALRRHQSRPGSKHSGAGRPHRRASRSPTISSSSSTSRRRGVSTTPEQFGAIVLRANPDGSTLRVRDVARVEMGAQNDDMFNRLNGKPAVVIGLYLSPGANAIETAAAVKSTLDKLRARFPKGLEAGVKYDSTTFVNDTIHEVLKTLFEAFVLVAVVVFVFLGQLRATIIPIIAVPVSLIGGIVILTAFGYSANTVSLLGMVLAIGIVVDDAIVVVENVERVMEEEPELSPAEAAKKAMTQVTAPIIGITLVLLSVFVPVAFIAGISGVLFKQFAVTIIGVGADLGVQRADLVACAVRPVPAAFGQTPRPDGSHQSRNRRRARRLCPRGAQARAAVGALDRAGRSIRLRDLRAGADDAHRLPARRGPGRLLRRRPAAGRRLRQPHQRRREQGRGHPEVHAPGPG